MAHSDDEKPVAGVIVHSIEPEEELHNKTSTAVYDSPKLSLSPSFSDDDLRKPCPAARPPSLGMLTVHPAMASNIDLEKGIPLSAQNTTNSAMSPLYAPNSHYSVGGRVKECSMWPSRQMLKHQAKRDQASRRGNTCFGLSAKWGGLSRKQRNIIRALLTLIVIAIAVGVAVGITKAVGGTVYGGKSGAKTISG